LPELKFEIFGDKGLCMRSAGVRNGAAFGSDEEEFVTPLRNG